MNGIRLGVLTLCMLHTVLLFPGDFAQDQDHSYLYEHPDHFDVPLVQAPTDAAEKLHIKFSKKDPIDLKRIVVQCLEFQSQADGKTWARSEQRKKLHAAYEMLQTYHNNYRLDLPNSKKLSLQPTHYLDGMDGYISDDTQKPPVAATRCLINSKKVPETTQLVAEKRGEIGSEIIVLKKKIEELDRQPKGLLKTSQQLEKKQRELANRTIHFDLITRIAALLPDLETHYQKRTQEELLCVAERIDTLNKEIQELKDELPDHIFRATKSQLKTGEPHAQSQEQQAAIKKLITEKNSEMRSLAKLQKNLAEYVKNARRSRSSIVERVSALLTT